MASKKQVDWVAVEKTLATKRVTHECYEHALARARQLVRLMEEEDSAVGLAILGHSRVGKSTILKAIRAEFPPYRLDDGVIMPVVYLEIPANPTILGILEVILEKLGDPRADSGSKANRTKRVKKLLKKMGVRVLALDEFQRVEDTSGARTQYKTTEILKELMDAGPTNLLVAGLSKAQKIIYLNEQLRGRFSKSIVLKRFDWFDAEDKTEFLSVLKQWREMLPMLKLPVLEEESMAFRFYCASGGLIGYAHKILKQAIWNAHDGGNPLITLLDLELAHLQAVEQEDKGDISPFSEHFAMADVPMLVADAKQIGQHVEPPKPSKPLKPKSDQGGPSSAHDALRAV